MYLISQGGHLVKEIIGIKAEDINFGAKEQIKDVYEFLTANLSSVQSGRAFDLYETPPKRVLTEKHMNKTLLASQMVPSCMIYFAWKDLPETKAEHGPFLDMEALKDKMVAM